MLKKLPYTDTNRQQIVDTEKQAGWFLIADERHTNGNRLTFSDKKPFDPSVEWKIAQTVTEKLNILARTLGIIDG